MSRTTIVVGPGRSPGSSPTIRVETDGPRGRAHLAARLLPPRGPLARLALVADGALLLAGDAVEVEVRLRPGTSLEILEPSGTVAYDMRGDTASWDVSVDVADGARLRWAGQPFVVASGADVRRSVRVALTGDAVVALREQLVLGRTGEAGGRLALGTHVTHDGAPLHVEQLVVDGAAPQVGSLATSVASVARVVETVSLLGRRGGAIPAAVGVHRLDLEGEATLTRRLSTQAHGAGLDAAWVDACASLAVAEAGATSADLVAGAAAVADVARRRSVRSRPRAAGRTA